MDVSFHWSTAYKPVEAPILEASEPANPSLRHAWPREGSLLHFMVPLADLCAERILCRCCGIQVPLGNFNGTAARAASLLMGVRITWPCIHTPCAQAASGRSSEDLAIDVYSSMFEILAFATIAPRLKRRGTKMFWHMCS